MVAALRPARLRRGLVGLLGLAALYGLAAQIASGRLPTTVYMAPHEIEGVELLPTYSSLAEEATFLVQAGILQSGVAVSTGRVLIGLLLGSAVGIALGLAMGWAAGLEYVLEPWVVLLRFTPALALLPLYVLWFGLGEVSKVGLIATSVAVVTLQGAYQGVRGIPRVYWDSAAALAAPRRLVVRRVILPAALPQILASLRIAIALGMGHGGGGRTDQAHHAQPGLSPGAGRRLPASADHHDRPRRDRRCSCWSPTGSRWCAYRWATRWVRRQA